MTLNFPNIDPVILPIGPLAITWYSLSYVMGVMLGWIYINKLIEKYSLSVTKKHMDDFITWVIIGIIVGGRLGYVFFYDLERYMYEPISILKTYEGGMSFHGGITGFAISTFLFCKSRKINAFELLDLSACATPIGLCLGRIANFINAELYGRVTDVPWAFIFPGSDGMPRHPSQLYESFLEGVVLFWILCYATHRYNALYKRGLTSGLFLVFYGLFRMLVEFFREPDAQIGYIAEYFTKGQILCLPMILLGIILIRYSRLLCQLTQK